MTGQLILLVEYRSVGQCLSLLCPYFLYLHVFNIDQIELLFNLLSRVSVGLFLQMDPLEVEGSFVNFHFIQFVLSLYQSASYRDLVIEFLPDVGIILPFICKMLSCSP